MHTQVKDAHHRGIVAKYCAKDCELVYRCACSNLR